MLLTIPATHPDASYYVAISRNVCGGCGAPVLLSDECYDNLPAHVCVGDYEWLKED